MLGEITFARCKEGPVPTSTPRAHSRNKILFIASEAHPLIKTGGLGDVAGALPVALHGLDQDVRLLLPAYREAMRRIEDLEVASLLLQDDPDPVRILSGTLPGSTVPVWLVDSPRHFDRAGNPYVGPDGRDWPDNAERFAAFARSAVAIALNRAGLDWQPDIAHCNDWQTGLVPALLSLHAPRPATVFTVHNLAYQGLFPEGEYRRLGLPAALWSVHGLEFYGQASYIKGGLAYADMLSTVSPTYAEEICTPAFGCGLEGLLRERADRLQGILNGADYSEWDPRHDPHLAHHYDAQSLQGKAKNKAELQRELGLPREGDIPLIGLVGRLVEQKGVDLVLAILPELLQEPVQVMILGNGNKTFEQALTTLAAHYPQRCYVRVGFSEPLAHRIEAGADLFLMPSRYEPCGLNQIYSLRYGTPPLVRRTGGLADTVVDLDEGIDKATGFIFDDASPRALLDTVRRALRLYRDEPASWRRLVQNGMGRDYGWERSAKAYLALYQQALDYAKTAEVT